jgi:hypothetical protein
MSIEIKEKTICLSEENQSSYISSIISSFKELNYQHRRQEYTKKRDFITKQEDKLLRLFLFLDYTPSFGINESIYIDINNGFPIHILINDIITKKNNNPVQDLIDKDMFNPELWDLYDEAKEFLSKGFDVSGKAKYLRFLDFYKEINARKDNLPTYPKIIHKPNKETISVFIADYNKVTNIPSYWEIKFTKKNSTKNLITKINSFNSKKKSNPFTAKKKPNTNYETYVKDNSLDHIIKNSITFQPELLWERLKLEYPCSIHSLSYLGFEFFYFSELQDLGKVQEAFPDLVSREKLKEEYGEKIEFLAAKEIILSDTYCKQFIEFYSNNKKLRNYLNNLTCKFE